jgi:hypothetical protein
MLALFTKPVSELRSSWVSVPKTNQVSQNSYSDVTTLASSQSDLVLEQYIDM